MDERALLLLGMLRAQSQHGYQINEFIERNLSRVTDMKKPTAYAILDRLAMHPHVAVAREVYSITEHGERAFEELLRKTLARADRFFAPGDIGLMFLTQLPGAEAVALLEQRLADLDEQRASYKRAPRHDYDLGARLAIERILLHLEAERGWLTDTITMLRETSDSEIKSVHARQQDA